MGMPMNAADASAVRKLLTATQRYRFRNEQEGAVGHHPQNGYRYQFDDFEGYDEDSDDERDFRDLSHYATIDPSTGRVTELWLGIIDAFSRTNDGDRYWTLSDEDWDSLSLLDELNHLKLSGCGGLPHRQLQELPFLKHISCSECGDLVAGNRNEYEREEDALSYVLPQIHTISIRCGFQANENGVKALDGMCQWIQKSMPNLERITIWRLDQQQHDRTNALSGAERKRFKRLLVDTLLDGLTGSTGDIPSPVTVLELNRCGINSHDFRCLLFDILPDRFPLLEKLSLSSNEITELPETACSTNAAMREQISGLLSPKIESTRDEPNINEIQFSQLKQRCRRLRRSLKQIHLSNNAILEFLGQSGDEHLQVLPEVGDADAEEGTHQVLVDSHDRGDAVRIQRLEEDVIIRRRLRKTFELQKLRDLLRLFPRLSHLGYASCVHNVLRSNIGDFVRVAIEEDPVEMHTPIPFCHWSREIQNEIEYFLRVNRGGRWIVEGGNNNEALVDFRAIWPEILEWSYRTSSSGCFTASLAHMKPRVQERQMNHYQSSLYQSSMISIRSPTHMPVSKNATALYHLLREGPALCGGERILL